MLRVFPEADVFSLVDFLPDEHRGMLGGRQVTTSFIQRLPFARKAFRAYLPLMPLAVEQLDLDRYDIVLSSSHAVAKGVLTRAERSMITLTALVVLRQEEELAMHLRAALRNGLSPGQISEVLLHTAVYAGVPAANRAFAVAARVLAEEGHPG